MLSNLQHSVQPSHPRPGTIGLVAGERQLQFLLCQRQALRGCPVEAVIHRLEFGQLCVERLGVIAQHIGAQLAELESMNSRLDRATTRRLPLAQQKVQLALASYQSNRGDLASVLAARREWIDARLAELQLRNQRDALAATLHYTYEEAAP